MEVDLGSNFFLFGSKILLIRLFSLSLLILDQNPCNVSYFGWMGRKNTSCTVQTVAADLRQGEHIPKMQNDIGHKSKLRVLRQRGGKEGGGALAAMPCRAVP